MLFVFFVCRLSCRLNHRDSMSSVRFPRLFDQVCKYMKCSLNRPEKQVYIEAGVVVEEQEEQQQ